MQSLPLIESRFAATRMRAHFIDPYYRDIQWWQGFFSWWGTPQHAHVWTNPRTRV